MQPSKISTSLENGALILFMFVLGQFLKNRDVFGGEKKQMLQIDLGTQGRKKLDKSKL